ncbi:MAG: ABC transporter permease subunit [Anaerocolumna sp.]
MNIFLRELRANRKALIIWSVCLFLLVLSGMGKYTAYSSGAATNEIFDKMPFTLKALLGFGSFDVTTLSGFFAFLFPYIELTAAIHAVLLGSGIIAKEERDKTTEFLMVKPVSRSTVITAKFLAALINIVIVNLVSLISSVMMVAYYNKGDSINSEIVMFFLSMFMVQLIFFSLGALSSAFIKKPRTSGSIATGVLFGAYILSKITDLTDRVNVLNVLTPFKYFNFVDIVNGEGLNLFISILTVLLAAVFLFFAYYFYLRRDLNI